MLECCVLRFTVVVREAGIQAVVVELEMISLTV